MQQRLKQEIEFLDNHIKNSQIATYHFNMNMLPDVDDFKTDIRKDTNFKELFVSLNAKKNHCLYWFTLDSHEKTKNCIDLLNQRRFELSEGKRVVPPMNTNFESDCLYVGIRRGGVRKYDNLSNISGRIIQHLGYYDKGSTQGLQLVHWIKGMDFNVQLHVIEFDQLPNVYLNVLEKLVANQLRPLCGKH